MQQSSSHIKETLAVGAAASLIILLLCSSAFGYFFFAENFLHLRVYGQHGGHLWQAAFSRIDGVFLNPGLFLTQLWWDFVLPANSVVYHIRNFLVILADVFILHRVLLKLVPSRSARMIGLALFVVSKIHLTVIGYLNIFGSSIMLAAILLAILFWLRFIETRDTLDYVLTLAFATFCVFSSDTGFFVVVILALMVPAFAKSGEWHTQLRFWLVRLSPLIFMGALFLAVAYIFIGPPQPNDVYSPQLSLTNSFWQLKGFLATVGNLSLTRPESVGQRGLTQVLAHNSKLVEWALCLGLWFLIGFTAWRARRDWRQLIVPAALIAVYLAPYLLIRNHQVYYFLIPLVGVVIIVSIGLEHARSAPLTAVWCGVILLIAMNGYISNQRSYYDWQYVANQAEIVIPIVMAEKCNPVDAVVFVTPPARLDFWVFTLGGPMVPHLIGKPNMQVRFVDSESQVLPNEKMYRLPEQFLK